MFHSLAGQASRREKSICMKQRVTKDGKVRLLKRFLVLILLICLNGVLISCQRARSPEAVTEAFFDAVGKSDTEAALQCFVPELRDQYRTALEISAELLNVKTGEILFSLAGIAYPVNDADPAYEIISVFQPDQMHAQVRVRIQTSRQNIAEVIISCIRIGRKWFLFM